MSAAWKDYLLNTYKEKETINCAILRKCAQFFYGSFKMESSTTEIDYIF